MNAYPKAVALNDEGEAIRVEMTVGFGKHFIVINKADGFAPSASVDKNSLLWGKLYRAAAVAITKSHPGQYPAIKA